VHVDEVNEVLHSGDGVRLCYHDVEVVVKHAAAKGVDHRLEELVVIVAVKAPLLRCPVTVMITHESTGDVAEIVIRPPGSRVGDAGPVKHRFVVKRRAHYKRERNRVQVARLHARVAHRLHRLNEEVGGIEIPVKKGL